jgi:Glycosyltransferase
MKVYIDITNLSKTRHITGIQRVVKETVERLSEEPDIEVILITYHYKSGTYAHLTENGLGEDIALSDMECGSVFFDMDNVWNMWLRRSSVIPYLKQRGVKIALYLYDIIPLTHPEYVHENTLINYLDYIGTYLLYADIILTSAESTLKKINELTDRYNMERINGCVCPLGADLQYAAAEDEEISSAVREAAKAGRYILMVGTIEPRKNHETVLRAFEAGLFEKGLRLIWVGNWGWNMEDLKKRVAGHSEYGNKFFIFSGLGDKELQYLYKNAYFLAFPSYTEGFGLPIVEAMKNGTPVLASDVDVMREVGGSWCDYFPPDNPMELFKLVNKYMGEERLYQDKKKRIKDYTFLSWDRVVRNMAEMLRTLNKKRRLKEPVVKQMVMLSSRAENFMQTLLFIENFMTYIEEIVLCCPDGMKYEVEKAYNRKLRIRFLTDMEALAGTPLPEDHTRRNFYLRCMAMQSELLDDTFIMSDDDYRPMFPMGKEVFYHNGKYIGYYFYMLGDWKGTGGNPTSFDSSMFRTYEFLKDGKYPCYQFSAHMPQIINRNVYLEMLNRYPEIRTEGLDEWSTYFNYMLKNYPEDIEIQPYMTLMWPGNSSDWQMLIRPEKYMFENYYSEHYEKGGIFEGFSKEWKENICEENLRKIVLYMNRQHKAECADEKYEAYRTVYSLEHREFPAGTVTVGRDITIYLPEYIVMERKSCHKLEFSICYENGFCNLGESSVLAFRYLTAEGMPITEFQKIMLRENTVKMDITIWGIHNQGEYRLEFEYYTGGKSGKGSCKAIIVA